MKEYSTTSPAHSVPFLLKRFSSPSSWLSPQSTQVSHSICRQHHFNEDLSLREGQRFEHQGPRPDPHLNKILQRRHLDSCFIVRDCLLSLGKHDLFDNSDGRRAKFAASAGGVGQVVDE